MLQIIVSSAAGNAVNHVQKKTSNIAAGYFNSYDSFDAKRFYKALPRKSSSVTRLAKGVSKACERSIQLKLVADKMII
jgi:hypothetical protein